MQIITLELAFWLNLFISLSLVIIGILMIPWIKIFLNEPLLGNILLILFLRLPFDVISKLPVAQHPDELITYGGNGASSLHGKNTS